jgi:hypothetical protein
MAATITTYKDIRWNNLSLAVGWSFEDHINYGSDPRKLAGVDIKTPVNTPIRTYKSGTVHMARTYPNAIANFVRVFYGDHFEEYGHLLKIAVKDGQKVKKGQILGYSGAYNRWLHWAWLNIKVYTFDHTKQNRINPITRLSTELTPVSSKPPILPSKPIQRPTIGSKLTLKLLNTNFGLIRFYTRNVLIQDIQAELVTAIKLRQVSGITNPNVVVYNFKNG